MPEKKVIETLHKRSALILILGALVSAGVGYTIYDLYATSEQREFERDFDLLASGTVLSAKVALDSMQEMCDHGASLYSVLFPDASEWPNVAVPRFAKVFDPVIDSLTLKNLNHIPLVRPDQLAAFETFAYDFFATDPETRLFPNLGVSPFGQGVFAVNSTGHKFHDTTGVTNFTSEAVIAPIFQVGKIESNAFIVMLNTHAEESRGSAINAVIECFNEKTAAEQDTTGCGALTDVLYLLQDSVPLPASILYYPEYPANNASVVTGMIGSVFNWDSILYKTVPNLDTEKNIKMVIDVHTPTDVFSFLASSSNPIEYLGSGRPYRGEYEEYRHSGAIYATVGMAGGSVAYTLNVYPHEDMVDEYFSDTPVIIAVIVACALFLAVVLLTSADYYITSQVYEVRLRSDLRQTFLRYVSHELRSPLNAVYMGVAELLMELGTVQSEKVSQENSRIDTFGHAAVVPTSGPEDGLLLSAQNIAKNIKQDTEMVMVVLDDLVTYVSLMENSTERDLRRLPVVSLKTVAEDSVQSIKSLLVEFNQSIKVMKTVSLGEGDKEWQPNIIGHEADLRMMFTYMLKVATKMCPKNGIITISFCVEKSPLDQRRHLKAEISYAEANNHVGNISTLKRSDSEGSLTSYSLDKLRTKSNTRDFVSSDLGNWLVYHIAARYKGSIEITSNDGVASIVFDFLHNPGVVKEFETAKDQIVRKKRHPRHRLSKVAEFSGVFLNDDQENVLDMPAMITPRDGSPSSPGSEQDSLFAPKSPTLTQVAACGDLDGAENEQMKQSADDVIKPTTVEGPRHREVKRDPVVETKKMPTGYSRVSTASLSSECEVVEPVEEAKPVEEVKWHLLCVDDVPSNRKILSRLLTKKGHTCVLACDGQEAVAMIVDKSMKFDAVCMDYEMPVMDGPTAAKTLRGLGVDIPIIGVTGNVLPKDVEYYKRMGANAVVGKPVDISILSEAIESAINDQRSEIGSECSDINSGRYESVRHTFTPANLFTIPEEDRPLPLVGKV